MFFFHLKIMTDIKMMPQGFEPGLRGLSLGYMNVVTSLATCATYVTLHAAKVGAYAFMRESYAF